jgi:hypothetical protein
VSDDGYRNLLSQTEDSVLSKVQFGMSAIYGISDVVLKATPSRTEVFL